MKLYILLDLTDGYSELAWNEQTWGWWLLQIGTPLVAVVGLVGNALSFFVLKTHRFRDKSYSHYLCTLAVFDSLVLVLKYLHRVDGLLAATGTGSGGGGLFDSCGDAACKVHNFVEHVCYLMSTWLVVCMTLERFIAVIFPFKKDTICRPRNAVTVILVIFAVMSYSQIFRLVVVENDADGLCTAPERYRYVYVVLHIYMYQLLLQFLLPTTIIVVCNLTILRKIRQLRHGAAAAVGRRSTTGEAAAQAAGAFGTSGGGVERGATTGSRTTTTRGRRSHKTTGMLLIVSFTYVVCLLPSVVVSLVMHAALIADTAVAGYLFVALNDVRRLFEFLSEINYATNFYIYVLSGVQFRHALRLICTTRYCFVAGMPPPTEKVFHFRKFASNS